MTREFGDPKVSKLREGDVEFQMTQDAGTYSKGVEVDYDEEHAVTVRDFGTFKIRIIPVDQYNLWRIIYTSGKTPKDLSGMWTTKWEATKAIETYLNERPPAVGSNKARNEKAKSPAEKNKTS